MPELFIHLRYRTPFSRTNDGKSLYKALSKGELFLGQVCGGFSAVTHFFTATKSSSRSCNS